MIKIERDLEIFTEHFDLRGKVIVDVGCGTGNLARTLTLEGASVTGLDREELIEKATEITSVGDEQYMTGVGEDLPLSSDFADIIVYLASFHHIPPDKMKKALSECYRVLKPGGEVIFIEPVAREGSYYELIKLRVDEKEIQEQAYIMIQDADTMFDFESEFVGFYYLERSFIDFQYLMDVYVDDKALKREVISKAREVISEFGGTLEAMRFKSITRVNILKKQIDRPED